MKSSVEKTSLFKKLFLQAGFIVALVFSSSLWALELHDAKEQGLVGETLEGYIAPVGSVTLEITALVDSINTQRKAEYQRIATKNGIAVSDVEALAGKKAIEKSAAGHYVKLNGQWQKR